MAKGWESIISLMVYGFSPEAPHKADVILQAFDTSTKPEQVIIIGDTKFDMQRLKNRHSEIGRHLGIWSKQIY